MYNTALRTLLDEYFDIKLGYETDDGSVDGDLNYRLGQHFVNKFGVEALDGIQVYLSSVEDDSKALDVFTAFCITSGWEAVSIPLKHPNS